MKAKVNSVKIDSYNLEKLDQHLAGLLAPWGGLEYFIKPGMVVLIKPNLLSARTPERAVTTNPELVSAIARKCIERGAKVILGDSPGGVEKGLKRVWDNTGMTEAAAKSKATLVSFESGGTCAKKANGETYNLWKHADDADFIISVPKLKTHVLTLYTGAVKNCFGFVPGLMKSEYHKSHPKPKSFSKVLVDIYSLVKPGLTIMDAGLAMEGDGPASGNPKWLGYLFAAVDGLALDCSIAELIGIKPKHLLTARLAIGRHIGMVNLDNIETTGPAFKVKKLPDFKLPSNFYMNLIPEFAVRTAGNYLWVRPAIKHELCTLCHTCVDNCPQNVIFERDGKLHFNYDECIKCMCCHELCPEKAVYLEKSWLAKRIGR